MQDWSPSMQPEPSVPRPWPARRPIWQLVFALLAGLASVASLVGFFLQSGGSGCRLLTTVLWTCPGVLWLVQWRRASQKYEEGQSQSDRPAGT